MLFPFDHGLKALREYLVFWGFAKCSQQQKFPKNSASVANAVIILLMLCILLSTHTCTHTQAVQTLLLPSWYFMCLLSLLNWLSVVKPVDTLNS